MRRTAEFPIRSRCNRCSMPYGNAQADFHGAQRRRAQVRQAQRAYRDREKALVARLQQDVDDLKDRLIGMESISNEWFGLITSIPNLSNKTKSSIYDLRKNAEQYRFSSGTGNTKRLAPKTGFCGIDANNTVLASTSECASNVSTSVSPLKQSFFVSSADFL
jgi:hypothetical protein